MLSGSVNDGVRTFHSWAGIGLGKYNAGAHAKFIRRNETTQKRICETDVVILDEISMMDPAYMEKVDDVLKRVRKTNLPFGGVQLIASGDFYQLPPVQSDQYMFESSLWGELDFVNVVLTKVYRQAKREFVEMLTKLRNNIVDASVFELVNKTKSNDLHNEMGIKPTVLYCRNANVDAMNAQELKKLPGNAHAFKARTYFQNEESEKEHAPNFSLLNKLYLKLDAQVMCLMNLYPEMGIVNGSRGVVTHIHNRFAPPSTWKEGETDMVDDYVQVKFMNGAEMKFKMEKQEQTDEWGNVVAWKKQFPFKLSWAITIHKSQGATIDLLDVDLNGCFAAGQVYVAISRGTSLDTMRIRNFQRKAVITDPRVVLFHNKISVKGKKRKFFHCDDNESHKRTKI